MKTIKFNVIGGITKINGNLVATPNSRDQQNKK
jgi:hypothetical protein